MPAIVGRERIAAGRHEVERVVEILARQVAIGLRAPDLGEEGLAVDRLGAGGADDVLGQHVEAGRPRRIAVEFARLDGLQRGQRFQHLEPVGRRDHGAAGLVEPVVGAADPLHQAADALGCAHLDHQVDVAPVDSEIERRGRHHRAQPAGRHRRLDLAPLLDGQRSVMQADRQVLVVDPPQRIERQFRLRARVHEDDRRPVLTDDVVDLRHRVTTHVAAPRDALLRVDDRHDRRRAGLAHHDLHRLVAQIEELGQRRRIRDGGREADEARLRGERRQPRQAERQMVPALAGGEGVQLVDDHALQVREELRRIEIGQQQRQRFRRRHQEVRRPLALAQPAALRRVAGPALRAHRQLHLGHRLFEVAADVRRQRLERRNVERVKLTLPLLVGKIFTGLAPLREFDQGRKKPGERLAAAGRRDQQRASALSRQIDQRKLVRPRRPAATLEPACKQIGKQTCRNQPQAALAISKST